MKRLPDNIESKKIGEIFKGSEENREDNYQIKK